MKNNKTTQQIAKDIDKYLKKVGLDERKDYEIKTITTPDGILIYNLKLLNMKKYSVNGSRLYHLDKHNTWIHIDEREEEGNIRYKKWFQKPVEDWIHTNDESVIMDLIKEFAETKYKK